MTNGSSGNGRDVQVRAEHIPTSISFGPSKEIDLSGLSEQQKAELMAMHAADQAKLSAKATEMGLDLDALRTTLSHLSNTTNDVAKEGNAVTATHTQETSIGRTEVIMGNTEQAQSGKLTKSQTGETNLTPFYIVGGLAALVAIAALLGG